MEAWSGIRSWCEDFKGSVVSEEVANTVAKAVGSLFRGAWETGSSGEAKLTISLTVREIAMLLLGLLLGILLGLAAAATDEDCEPRYPWLSS